ncbi:MAG: LamG domain-containing protein, partial [Planctomycetes bacterium]|nr:LamG domain-containing protein [Planctomycetota bacterium]
MGKQLQSKKRKVKRTSNHFSFSLFLMAGILAGSVTAQSLVPIDPATVTDGHVYLMENVGVNVPDDSANNNHGTFVGSPQVVDGLNGKALRFNGTSDGVVLPNAATINTSTHQNKTIMAVFKCADVSKSAKQCVFEEGGSTRGLNIYVHQGLVYAGGWNAADYTPQWAGTFHSAPIGSDEWHVVAAVLRGGGAGQENDKFEMWLDGKLVAKGPGGELRSRTNANGIGYTTQTKYHDGNVTGAASGYFEGIVDEIWILNRAMTKDELAALSMGPRPFASGPSPKKGALLEETLAVLSWKPGDFAVSHDLYLGTSAEEVAAATPQSAAFRGNLTTASFVATDLIPGTTYYWRVDEINPAEPNSPWKGEVWSFRVRPVTAWNPTPTEGLQYVGLNEVLRWNPGMGVAFHTVFLGTSYDEVKNAVVGMMTADPTYNPGPLKPGTTYYWRVDQFAFPANVTHKGDVWSFTTVPEIPIADPELVGWWTFDEGAGLTAVDWSGQGNHGTLVGNVQRVDGYHGQALQFDGNSYVNCGTGATLKIRDRITVACWIKVASFTRNWEAILAMGDDSYRMSRSATTGNSIHFGCNGPTGGNLDAVTTVTDNKWHHVALVYDGANKIIYLDGVEDARVASTGQINVSAYALYIGANSQQAGRGLAGLVDDVRIYS